MNKKLSLFLILNFFYCSVTFAQYKVFGSIRNTKDESVFSAKVILASSDEKAYIHQVFTDKSGNFILKTNEKTGKLIIKAPGYQTLYKFVDLVSNKLDVGIIYLEEDLLKNLETESILVDLATIRKSPIAASTLFENKNFNTNSNKDFIERTTNLPGVFTTTLGGGYTDAQIRMRGYDQSNITPIVDGIALNDPETGNLNWGFIAPASDALESVQLQRGLGASKLVNASVAGTLNFNLKDPFTANGNSLSLASGNNGYVKYSLNASTGAITEGFGLNFTLTNTKADGYVPGTNYNATGYYLTMGYLTNKHRFVFKVLGAPQWHNQRIRMEYLQDNYNLSGNQLNYNLNTNTGLYYNDPLSLNTQTSHTPISTLEWQYKINKNNTLSLKGYTVLGFNSQKEMTGESPYLKGSPFRFQDGTVDFDYIRKFNIGTALNYYGTNNEKNYYRETISANGADLFLNSRFGGTDFDTGFSLVENYRQQKTYGGLLNYQTNIKNIIKFNVGLDFRNSSYDNMRYVNNLFGADGYLVDGRTNREIYTNNTFNAKDQLYNPFKSIDARKVDYNNKNNILYGGAYSQIEINFKKINFLVQGGYNRNEFKKEANHVLKPGNKTTTETVKTEGYNTKLGLNWNITKNHNLWLNTGLVSRAPIFNYVFDTYNAKPNKNFKNENFKAAEIGYSFLNKKTNINLSAYYNRLSNAVVPYSNSSSGFFGITEDINKENYGLELDAIFKVTKNISIETSNNYGVWNYKTNAKFTEFAGINPESALLVTHLQVGGAPRLMNSIGVNIMPLKGLTWKLLAKHHDLYYTNAPAEGFDPEFYKDSFYKDVIQLPSFTLFDTALNYNLTLQNNHIVSIGLSMNNVFNTKYITESITSYTNDQKIESTNSTYGKYYPNGFKNINGANNAFFGFGRTWNFAVQYKL